MFIPQPIFSLVIDGLSSGVSFDWFFVPRKIVLLINDIAQISLIFREEKSFFYQGNFCRAFKSHSNNTLGVLLFGVVALTCPASGIIPNEGMLSIATEI